MPKTKSGEVISWKEFFVRWKQGIDSITPFQKVKSELRGTFITLLGFVVSLLAVIYARERIGLLSYGLILIFLGSIITTALKYLSLRQQRVILSNLQEQFDKEEELINKSKEAN